MTCLQYQQNNNTGIEFSSIQAKVPLMFGAQRDSRDLGMDVTVFVGKECEAKHTEQLVMVENV